MMHDTPRYWRKMSLTMSPSDPLLCLYYVYLFPLEVSSTNEQRGDYRYARNARSKVERRPILPTVLRLASQPLNFELSVSGIPIVTSLFVVLIGLTNSLRCGCADSTVEGTVVQCSGAVPYTPTVVPPSCASP